MATNVSFAAIFIPPLPPEPFIGRQRELGRLHELIIPKRRGIATPISVVGAAGIGKTALVAEEIRRLDDSINPIWFRPESFATRPPGLFELIDSAPRRRSRWPYFVILDGAESIPERQLLDTYRSALSRKDVASVVVTSRAPVEFRGINEIRVEPMPGIDIQRLLREKISLSNLDDDTVSRMLDIAKGSPDSASIFAAMASSMPSEQLERVLSGNLYQATEPKDPEAIANTKTIVVNLRKDIMDMLKKRPSDVNDLTWRQFEELVADLMQDKGFDVKLTPATRDGGADILATRKLGTGEELYLVDAKKYKKTRKIGVEKVRTLYGLLTHRKATKAMLVTTTSFTKDARELEHDHKYQLTLSDYAEVALWIQNYGKG
jgi:restriction system protein